MPLPTIAVLTALPLLLATKLSLVADAHKAPLRLSCQAELDGQALPSEAW